MRSIIFKLALTFAAAAQAASCGTRVPDIHDNPFLGESERSRFIQDILRNIKCEVQDSVVRLYDENSPIDPQNRNLYWFDSWAVQISLTLTTDEKGTISPNGNAFTSSPVDKLFNIDLGLSASSEAQRVDKIGAFFTVKDLKGLKQCNPISRQKGPFILQSDLKLFE